MCFLLEWKRQTWLEESRQCLVVRDERSLHTLFISLVEKYGIQEGGGETGSRSINPSHDTRFNRGDISHMQRCWIERFSAVGIINRRFKICVAGYDGTCTYITRISDVCSLQNAKIRKYLNSYSSTPVSF